LRRRTTPELEPPRCSSALPAGRPAYGRRERAERIAGVRGREQSRAPPLSLDSNGSWGPLVRFFVFIFLLI